jgi:hypothetical protein
LYENFFDFFDFAVKKFCGSSLAEEDGGTGKRFGLSRKRLRKNPGDDFLHDVMFGKVK